MPKHDRDDHGSGQDTALKRPRLELRPAVSGNGYGLIHTLGRTRYDELGGDGAYAKWMQAYFENSTTPDGCRAVAQIKMPPPYGNISDRDLPEQFNPPFLNRFEAEVNSQKFQSLSRIILNWHIRFTGTPNGYTGRGINQDLVKRMGELCEQSGKRLGIVYTVHEDSQLGKKLLDPAGVVTLNEKVGKSMAEQFPGVGNNLVSKVPGLMQSTHTVKIDTLLRLVGEYLDPVDLYSDASNLFWAHGQQLLRLSNAPAASSARGNGVVIFGMIMPRHGLNTNIVKKLADRMNEAGLSPSLKIVIAGKESDDRLVSELKRLSVAVDRISFAGQIHGLDELAGCRYAISFDPNGYRTNASSMVNVVREGHVLFSRESNESDDALIARAVRDMTACERSKVTYYDMLARSQPRLREASSSIVGTQLNDFFANVARNL